MAGVSNAEFDLSDNSADPERFSGARITANSFRLLRMEPVLGRDFLPEEDQLGADSVVLLSHGLWQDRYGGDSQFLGQIVSLVLAHALRRVSVGVVLGLPLAFGAAHVLGEILIGVAPSDAITLGGVSGFLFAVALVACWLPARRVVRIDPGSALRHE